MLDFDDSNGTQQEQTGRDGDIESDDGDGGVLLP